MGNITLHRPARTFPDTVPADEVRIVAPPTLPAATGALASLIQNMLMPVAGLGGMAYLFVFARSMPVFVIIAIGLASGIGVLAPMLSRWAQGRVTKKQQAGDHRRYLEHLQELETRLHDAAEAQFASMLRLHPDPEMLEQTVRQGEVVWERRPQDDDFLHCRAGTGAQPLRVRARLDLGSNPLLVYEPELLSIAQELESSYQTLADAPVAIPLTQYGSLVVEGARAQAHAMLRSLLCQMSVYHSPDDVMLAVHSGNEEIWRWIKWLPHARDPRQPGSASRAPASLRFENESALLEYLTEISRERSEEFRRISEQKSEAFSLPQLVLVVDGYQPTSALGRSPVFGEILSRAKELRITVISLVDNRNQEPAHADARIALGADRNAVFEEARAGGERISGITADALDGEQSERIARLISPLRGSGTRNQNELARTIRLLDLMHLPSVNSMDTGQIWMQRNAQDTLAVPIGLSTTGQTVVLDLKEAAAGGMGPHGMVIGATGSGKSELLRTIVGGLAIAHPPELLNFVFADFKGGAAFAGLSELPHVAGMITNLQDDLLLVDRMRSALVGEQHRRQQLLRDAGNVDNVREYQAMAARNRSLPEMPYLLIVVDEFGELLQARPDFLELFTAIGRVGRSLGMHLLLSTQRLDEGRIRGLEGHLRFRICLRTFSAQESQAVIGTPDAYNLPSFPGVGYLKVDTSIYEKFKCALISTPLLAGAELTATGQSYSPHQRARERSSGIDLFDGITTTLPAKAGAGIAESGGMTEMDAAVARINASPQASHPVHQVWLPPLPAHIGLPVILQQAPAQPPLAVAVGLLDEPERQAQEALRLDFSGTGGHLALVGAPLTGKSTFLRTLISAFAFSHSPGDAQFYCIDLGGGSLHRLETLPHVGAVCAKHEREKILTAIRQMQSIIEEREPLFRREGIDSMATFRQRRAQGKVTSALGDCFLVIDNWAALKHDFEEIEGEIQPLLAGGLAYGVHLVITTGRWNDIRPQLRDAIGTRLEFRLHDATESEMPRGANLGLPVGIPGRGITSRALHFQVAWPGDETEEPGTEAQRRWTGHAAAPPLRLLPAKVEIGKLPPPPSIAGVPLGLQEFSLQPVVIDLFRGEPHFLILGDSESGKTTTIRTWMRQLGQRYSPQQVQFLLVDYRRTLLDMASDPHLGGYAGAPAMVAETVSGLSSALNSRLPGPNITRQELVNRSWWQGPEFVLFVDDYDLVTSATGNPLSPLLELLVHGRDVGFHLVLARRVGGIARSSFEPVFQRVRELGSPGFVLSGDPQEGAVLGTQKASHLPAGRALWVRRGERTLQVQLLHSSAEGGDG